MFSLSDDLAFFSEIMKHNLSYAKDHRTKDIARKYDGNIYKFYFKNINKRQLLQLYNIFKYDFMLFNYDFNSYKTYVAQ